MRDTIASNWENVEKVLADCIHPDFTQNDDAKDVAAWMNGRAFTKHEMYSMAESEDIEIIMPFLYANDEALPYVLGVYLIILEQRFKDDLPIDFAVMHYYFFARDPKFLKIFKRLNLAQKWITYIATKKLVNLINLKSDQDKENIVDAESIQKIENNIEQCCEWSERGQSVDCGFE